MLFLKYSLDIRFIAYYYNIKIYANKRISNKLKEICVLTIKQEWAYRARINAAIEAERDWDRRNDAGEFDGMDDAEWRHMMESIVHAVYVAKMAFFDVRIKAIRPNEWYTDFLASFGVPPENPEQSIRKSVSTRQAEKLREKGEWHRDSKSYFFRAFGNVYQLYGTLLIIRKQFL